MASNVSARALGQAFHHLPTRKLLPRRQCLQQTTFRLVTTYTSPHQANKVSVLPTTVDTNSKIYEDNAASMGELMKNLTQLHEVTSKGGPDKARAKHLERGKLLVRDRITALIDPGSSFLELSALAGHELYPGEDVPAGGMVTGIGTVEGVQCMIVANDST